MLHVYVGFYVLTGVFLKNGKLDNTYVRVYKDYNTAIASLEEIAKDFVAKETGKTELHISEHEGLPNSYATFKGEDGRDYRWDIVKREISISD